MAEEEIPFPDDTQIEPLTNDPLMGIIKLSKEIGVRIKDLPFPLSNMVGDSIQLTTNQAEALHLTVINALRFKNFIDAGGIEATQQEMVKAQQNPARPLEMLQEAMERVEQEWRRNFE